MKRNVALLVLLMIVFTFALSQGFAMTQVVDSKESAATDMGNKFCPVTGEPVSGKDFMIYEGKRYGLCCPMCEGMFKKDPEKYLAKMKEQEAASGKEGSGVMAEEKGIDTVGEVAHDESASSDEHAHMH